MNAPLLSQFSALSFDCYGTLIDWETGIASSLEQLIERGGLDTERVVEAFGCAEHQVEAEHPGLLYSEVLAKVYDRLAHELRVEASGKEARAFGASVGDWPAFADVPDALAYLKKHYRLIILSNVDRASFARSNERLGVIFDAVLTAEEIGSYKPDLRNFEYLVARLAAENVAKEQLLHVAQSLYHDHGPANRIGIASAWIDRRCGKIGSGATPMPDPMPHVDFRFTTLEELAKAHHAEQQ